MINKIYTTHSTIIANDKYIAKEEEIYKIVNILLYYIENSIYSMVHTVWTILC